MDFFEKEMRQMFEHTRSINDQVFVGKTMMPRLDDNKLLKLEFHNTHVGGQYNSILLSVINKNTGVIDKETIEFSDVIGKCKMRDGTLLNPYIWDDRSDPHWYTPISIKQKAEIADKVLEYAEMFQDIEINNANMFL